MRSSIFYLTILSIFCITYSFSLAGSGSCPCGTNIAKFEWNEKTLTWVPEYNDGVTITGWTTKPGEPTEPMSVNWISNKWTIAAVLIKHGSKTTTQSFSPAVMEGTSSSPDKHAVSNLIFCGESHTPIELTSFSAHWDGKSVQISWQTATETENLGFHLYRSSTENGVYEQITTQFIPGAGNSDRAHSYFYVDRQVALGSVYYYKLADIDFAGNLDFHGPISVTTTLAPSKYQLEPARPNPFNPETVIAFSIQEPGQVSLKIYNLQGVLVRTLLDETRPAGRYSLLWNGTDDSTNRVSSGTYIIQFKVNDFKQSGKLVLIR